MDSTFLATLTVSQVHAEMDRLLHSLQRAMRDHECKRIRLSPSELNHLHRAILEADFRSEWLAHAEAEGHGGESFTEFVSRHG